MAPQWIGRGLFLQSSALTLAIGIGNVIACFPLVNAYGMKGAAYSLLGVSVVLVLASAATAIWVNRRVAAEELAKVPEPQLR
jgi:O-antigen/teichoic acid export membrane protein